MKLDYERPLMAYAYLAQSGAQNAAAFQPRM